MLIGFDAALTGGLASYETPVLQGMQYALRQINATGGANGRKLVLKVMNNGSDASTSATVAQTLVSDGVKVLITTCDPGPTLAAGPIAAAAHIPVMSACAGAPTLRKAIGSYFFFAPIITDNEEAAVQAHYAIQHGYRKAFILTSNGSAYTQDGPQYFAKAFEAAGGHVVGQTSYTLGQTSFSAQVAKIQATNPQM